MRKLVGENEAVVMVGQFEAPWMLKCGRLVVGVLSSCSGWLRR
jgi:hypothetical protein